jgi:iron(II)-dependent oxidoreductase
VQAAASVKVSDVETKLAIRSQLERAREGTVALLAPLTEAQLGAQISPSHSPLIWDYASIAYFEELWLLRNLDGHPALSDPHAEVYDAFRHEPSGDALPPLRPAAIQAYAADVRERALELLERIDLDAPNPLLRRGFVYGLTLQHELEHQETMLQTLQLIGAEYPQRAELAPDRAPAGSDEIQVEGGSFVLGAVEEPWAYDNELVPHEVEVRPFWIDRTPVTNGAFAEFIEDKGYRSKKLWSPAGWEWRQREGASAPLYWERNDGGWDRLRFGRREPVPVNEPVQHVSFHEAEAYARWAGKRLPTEIEWERAAGWSKRVGKSRFPWGSEWMGYEANLDRRRFGPTSAGSYSGGESASGCLQMSGDVWEWTSSWFQSYPGFLAFPHPECSEVFFGEEYRVLRGGSWATDSVVARTTFRNFDVPERRQIFAGFRCARDA